MITGRVFAFVVVLVLAPVIAGSQTAQPRGRQAKPPRYRGGNMKVRFRAVESIGAELDAMRGASLSGQHRSSTIAAARLTAQSMIGWRPNEKRRGVLRWTCAGLRKDSSSEPRLLAWIRSGWIFGSPRTSCCRQQTCTTGTPSRTARSSCASSWMARCSDRTNSPSRSTPPGCPRNAATGCFALPRPSGAPGGCRVRGVLSQQSRVARWRQCAAHQCPPLPRPARR